MTKDGIDEIVTEPLVGKTEYSEKTYLVIGLSSTNLRWIDRRLNHGRKVERSGLMHGLLLLWK